MSDGVRVATLHTCLSSCCTGLLSRSIKPHPSLSLKMDGLDPYAVLKLENGEAATDAEIRKVRTQCPRSTGGSAHDPPREKPWTPKRATWGRRRRTASARWTVIPTSSRIPSSKRVRVIHPRRRSGALVRMLTAA